MRLTRGWKNLAGAALLMTAAAHAACDDPPLCYDGEYLACHCDGAFGYQSCVDGAYATCNCDEAPPGLGGGPPATGAGGMAEGGAALLPFMADCDEDGQCETGLCYLFPAKGPHCSKACGEDGDCEPPSPGCNMMGICKAP